MSDVTPEDASDPAVARAERRLRLLERLTEIGMELAEALRERVLNPAADAAVDSDAKGRDPADAYARLSRAIRLTIALEAKTDQALADLKAGVVREREEARAKAEKRGRLDPEELTALRQLAVGGLVADVASVEIDNEADMDALCEALDERLEEDEAYAVLTDRPLREIVEQLCRDLELSPDWSQWLDEENGWAPGYIPTRPRWSAFNQPSRRAFNRASPPDETEPERAAGVPPVAGQGLAAQTPP